ncbi:MAG TPA: acyltransferase [Acidimicrobiales bacterium]|nr:acyltransferase [Acidimicrobiales bacterium]
MAAPVWRDATAVGPELGEPRSPVRLLRPNPALDGLRGLAVLLVIGYHFRPGSGFSGGWMGVDVFFALSGFLITSLVLDELATTGRFSFLRFHIRRALRLQPALWLFLAVWLVGLLTLRQFYWFHTVPGFAPAPGPPTPLWVGARGVLTAMGEVNNWFSVRHVAMPPIGHLWSLSIEEQFYLVWPALLLVVARFRPQWMLRATVGLGVASALDCLVQWNGGAGTDRIYFGTDTRAQALLAGCLVAQLWTSGRLERMLTSRLTRRLLFSGAAVVLAAVAWFATDRSAFRYRGGFTLIALAAAILVAVLAVEEPAGRTGASVPAGIRVLSWGPLRYVGSRSYAVYLWNYVFATWFHPLGAWSIVPGVAATFLAAEVSWRLVERPALALKSRWAPRPGAAAPPRSRGAVPAG